MKAIRFSLILIAAIVSVLIAASLTQAQDRDPCAPCGDFDGSGSLTISDFVALNQFLYGSGTAPANPYCADFDGSDLITLRDFLIAGQFTGATCVMQPKLISSPTTLYKLTAESFLNYGTSDSFYTETIYLDVAAGKNLWAFDLPLSVRSRGSIPLSIQVSTASETFPGSLVFDIDEQTGTIIAHGTSTTLVNGGYYRLGVVTIKVPWLTECCNEIDFTYTTAGPYMTGVFEPPNSPCRYPMLIDGAMDAWEPQITSGGMSCMCGDADNNGLFSISDPVYMMSYIFAGGPAPATPCLGDANGDCKLNISDAVLVVGYIFAGGAAPLCPCN